MNFTEGMLLGPLEIDVDRALIADYAQASGDHNPIHVDDAAARALGLPGVIAHGMWTMGAALRLVEQAAPGARITRAFTRFGRPLVLPADGMARLRVVGTVAQVDEAGATIALEASALVGASDERIAKLEVHVA